MNLAELFKWFWRALTSVKPLVTKRCRCRMLQTKSCGRARYKYSRHSNLKGI